MRFCNPADRALINSGCDAPLFLSNIYEQKNMILRLRTLTMKSILGFGYDRGKTVADHCKYKPRRLL